MKNVIISTIKDHFPINQAYFEPYDIAKPIEAVFKRGADGCSGLSDLKISKTSGKTTDRSVFSSMIALVGYKQGDRFIFLEKNPNSPFICRPVSLTYQKETSALIKLTSLEMEKEISLIENFEILLNEKPIKFAVKVFNSMNDGKGLNALYGNKFLFKLKI